MRLARWRAYSLETRPATGTFANAGSAMKRARSSKASFLASTMTCQNSEEERPIALRSKLSRMLSISRAVRPWPLGGIS
jgi:hypothetical protein